MQKIEIQASNIKCGGCVNNVQNALAEFKGISSVSVDIPSNIVTVEGETLDQPAIEAKLAEAGYPAI